MSSTRSSISLLLLGLLLFATLTQATRAVPADPQAPQQQLGVAAERTHAEAESCGDDYCMGRKALEAHLDYIYTQEKKN